MRVARWEKRPDDDLSPEQLQARAARRAALLEAGVPLLQDDAATPMTDIARAAGMGMSSVYRTFASKDELLGELVRDRLATWNGYIAAALARPDHARAFADLVRTCAEQSRSDGQLSTLLQRHSLAHPEIEGSTELLVGFDEMIARGVQAGVLRPDTTYDDLLSLFSMLRGVASGSRTPAAWDRALEIYLAGLRP